MITELRKFIKQHGWLPVAAACGFDDTFAVKRWMERRKVPTRHVAMIDSLINGEKYVLIKLVSRKKAKA